MTLAFLGHSEPRLRSPTGQGNPFDKAQSHLLPPIRPDSPCSLPAHSRPTPPPPSISQCCAPRSRRFLPAVEGSDDRDAPFSPQKPALWDSVRSKGFVHSAVFSISSFSPATHHPQPQLRLSDSPSPSHPPPPTPSTKRVAEASPGRGAAGVHPRSPKCDGALVEGPGARGGIPNPALHTHHPPTHPPTPAAARSGEDGPGEPGVVP